MASEALDICTEGLYTSYAYDYPMVELQETLFRNSSDLDTSDSSDFVVQPLNRGAKRHWDGCNNPNWRGGKLRIKCDNCGNFVYRNKSKLKNKKWIFCNKECMDIWQRNHSKEEYSDLLKNRNLNWLIKRTKQYEHIIITPETEQVLIGTMLGDGNLRKQGSTTIRLGHSEKQKDYILWKISLLNLPFSKLYKRISGKYISYMCYSIALPQLNIYHQMFYPNGKKVVTKEILDKLGPLGLAVWYLDDGCLSGGRLRICSECFTYEEHVLIKEYFKRKYDINISIENLHNNQHRISITKHNEIKKFINIINPFIINSMNYKIDFETNLKKIHINAKNYRKTKKFQEWYKKHTSSKEYKTYRRKYSREYRKKNFDKIIEYRLLNDKKVKEYKLKWYLKNKDNPECKLKRKIAKQIYNAKKNNIKNSFKLIFGK